MNKISSPGEALDTEFLRAVNDYFNLCSEEYYFYCEGYIPAVVWRSWVSGMKHFFKHERIREIWGEESEYESESYYGFKEYVNKELLGLVRNFVYEA